MKVTANDACLNLFLDLYRLPFRPRKAGALDAAQAGDSAGFGWAGSIHS
jgi:hypothetical protein